MALKDKMNWFAGIDRALWGDTLVINRYFTTLAIMTVAVFGAFSGGSGILGYAPDNFVGIVASILIIWGISVAETLIGSTSVRTSVLRSLMLLIVFPAVFAIGFIAAIVVLIIVAIWLILLFFSSMLSGSIKSGMSGGGSSSGGSESDGDNGEYLDLGGGNKVRGWSSVDGNTFHGDDGSTYTRSGYNSWSKDE